MLVKCKRKSIWLPPVASDHRPVYLEVRFDTPTSIQSPSENDDAMLKEDIYDLSGKKITSERLTSGIYIQKKKDESRKFVSRN